LPPHDLAQALPGILVAVLLPGFALATLIAPLWRVWERMAAAPGLSAGFLGVLGLIERLAHVPFEPLTVFPCIGLLCAAAVFRHRRSGPIPEFGLPWWIPIPALVAGMVGAAVFAWALSGQVLPLDWDPRVHAALAAAIARTHDVLPLFPIPLQGTSFARARPGFEAMTAVVSWVGGPSPAESMAPIIAMVLVLLPLGLTMLALEATGSVALALVVPLLAAGLAFPSDQAIVGRFPQVVDSTLVVPLIVAAVRLIRDRQPIDNALLVAAATASIWVVHGLEVLTALVVGGVLLVVAAVVAIRKSPLAALLRIGATGLAVVAGAAAVTLITRLPHTAPPTVVEPSTVPTPPASMRVPWHTLIATIAQSDLTSPIAVGLFGIGVVAVLVQRRLWWLAVSGVVVLLAMADSLYARHLGNAVWRRLVFPWGDADRLLGVLYWVVPFIVAAGLLALGWLMRRLARDRGLRLAATVAALVIAAAAVVERGPLDRRWTQFFSATPVTVQPLGLFEGLTHLGAWRFAAAVTAGAIVLAWVGLSFGARLPRVERALSRAPVGAIDAVVAGVAIVALLFLAVGARAEMTVYQRAVLTRSTATSADLAVLATMQRELPRGATVLTDGLDDAGIWVAGVTDLTPLVPNGSEDGALSLPLVVALAHACQDPGPAELAIKHADAVFVGSHHIPGIANTWNEGCIARLPGLRLIASDSSDGAQAAGFAVTR
jgi:hypothetical protein